MTQAELRDVEERARLYPGLVDPATLTRLIAALREERRGRRWLQDRFFGPPKEHRWLKEEEE